MKEGIVITNEILKSVGFEAGSVSANMILMDNSTFPVYLCIDIWESPDLDYIDYTVSLYDTGEDTFIYIELMYLDEINTLYKLFTKKDLDLSKLDLKYI